MGFSIITIHYWGTPMTMEPPISQEWCSGPRHANDMHHTPLLPVPVTESLHVSEEMPQWSSDPVWSSGLSMAFFFFFFFFLGSWKSCDSFKVNVTNWTPTTVPAQKKKPAVHCTCWNPLKSTTLAFHDLLSFFIPTFIPLLGCNKKSTARIRSTGNFPDMGFADCFLPWVPSHRLGIAFPCTHWQCLFLAFCWIPKNQVVTLGIHIWIINDYNHFSISGVCQTRSSACQESPPSYQLLQGWKITGTAEQTTSVQKSAANYNPM